MPWRFRGIKADLSRSAKSLAALAIVCGATGCGTISRLDGPAARLDQLRSAPLRDPRTLANDPQQVEALAQELSHLLQAPGRPIELLALSGGGADGAYGAGLLVGWTATGRRPEFTVVTGVSTGALTAPFAFLGTAWDDELTAAYTGRATEGLLQWRLLRALVAPSVFSSGSLRELIEKNVTQRMLKEIAAEHAKGRRLLVVTTNLDNEETVIWDLGLLATRGDDEALKLFRKVLLASASIPGVFPPVLFSGFAADGRTVDQMHVDGGVNVPFLVVPNALLLPGRPEPNWPNGTIYVLVNGKLESEGRVTGGSLRSILERSYSSASKASVRTHLAATAAFAARRGMTLCVAAIPAELESSNLEFEREFMTRLFAAGQSRAVQGEAWRDIPRLRQASSASIPSSPAQPDAELSAQTRSCSLRP